MKLKLSKDKKENGLRIFNMKYLNLFSATPKKIKYKKNNSSLDDSNLLLNDNKFSSIKSDLYFSYPNNNSKKEENDKDSESLKYYQKYFIKRGILIKNNSNMSKTNSQFGSFTRNSQSKINPYKTTNINFYQSVKNIKKFSPVTNDIKKVKWDQYGILNLSKKNARNKKMNLNFMNNANNIETIKYKRKIKEINSSFSPKSSFYNEQKLLNNNSSRNFLFNSSLFSDSNFLDSPKSVKSKIFEKRRKFSEKKIKFNNIIIPNKKIYQLIIDHGWIEKFGTFIDIPEELLRMNNKSIKNLEIDNQKLFNKYFCIIDRKKFKKVYQNPFTSPFEKKVYDVEKQEKEEKKQYINEEVFNSNKQLLKDMTIELKRYKNRNKKFLNLNDIFFKNKNKNPVLERFKMVIIKLSKYLGQITVSLSEILKEYKFIKVCFTYNATKELLSAIKAKKIDQCNKILNNNKHIVLDYDYYYLTPLHWAVKKNLYQIVPKLIEYGSIIDSQNFLEETPLHIAIKINSYDCVSLLLVNLASPFIKNKDGKKPIDITNDYQMKDLLEKITNFYYLSFFHKYSEQFEVIQKYFTFFIVNEFSRQLNEDTLLYFKKLEKKFRKK